MQESNNMTEFHLVLEQKYYKVNGCYYVCGDENDEFLQRYKLISDNIFLTTRVTQKNIVEDIWQKIDSNVKFNELPDYSGIIDFTLKIPLIFIRLYKIYNRKNIPVILRVPGLTTYIVALFFLVMNKRYCLEVVTDPSGEVKNKIKLKFIGKLLDNLGVKFLKIITSRAHAVSCVTSSYLQRKYPSNAKIKSHYSSIELPDSDGFNDYLTRLDIQANCIENPTLGFIGRLSSNYKGLDILINSIKRFNDRGFYPICKIIGGGSMLDDFKSLVKEYKVEDSFEFLGEIKDKLSVFSHLKSVDVFVLPSRREGLPRCVIEAMSLGIPCVSSRVGGVEELLPNEYLFEINDVDGLVDRTVLYLREKERRKDNSILNFQVAREFQSSILNLRREKYYKQIRKSFYENSTNQ